MYKTVSKNKQDMDERNFLEYYDDLNTYNLNFKDYFLKKINWDKVSKFDNLSDNFIIEFQDKINWNLISQKKYISEDFIRKFQHKVNWEEISKRNNLSDTFIKEFKSRLNFLLIHYNKKH